MERLQNKLVEMLRGYKFEELEKMLNEQKAPEVRESIMNAMELYHEDQFLEWIG